MILIKKYDQESIRYLNLFEQISRIRPKDCISIEDTIFFFTERGTTKVAVGKQGMNVKKLRDALKRDVKIIEWSDDAAGLVKSYLFPTRAIVTLSEEGIEIRFKTAMQRRYLLSDQQKKLKQLIELVKNYYPSVKGIRVL